MNLKSGFYLLILAFLISTFQQLNGQDYQKLRSLDHPRLFFTPDDQKQLLNVRNTPALKLVHEVIIEECNSLIDQPVLIRKMSGKRILHISREALKRVSFLSYAYRMTNQEKYLTRCEQEILSICNFSDWNPSHFLDVAEMTFTLALGYDWLYHSLSADTKKIIVQSIINKGLKVSCDAKYNGWSRGNNNWNQVCNAGITIGAMAIFEHDPDLCKSIIERAIVSIKKPMVEYGPDGAYPEGGIYWSYGTTYNVFLLDAFDHIFKSDFGLSQTPGFMQSAEYIEFISGSKERYFNYSDAAEESELRPDPTMFWFASRLKNSSLLWVEMNYLKEDKRANIVKDRFLPFFMIWARNTNFDQISQPVRKMWVGKGKTPVALIRSTWKDDDGIYLGIKGGSTDAGHAHMDFGSFVLDCNGIRWAMDFGAQDYNSLESNGLDIWNIKQGSDRWKVFRYNNSAHNTLIFDGKLQNTETYSPIIQSVDTPDSKMVVLDLSAAYSGQVEKVLRSAELINDKIVEIRDEIKTNNKETLMRWNILTPATVKFFDQNTILLEKEGKQLFIRVDCENKIDLKTWTTQSTQTYDQANPGTIFTGFECLLKPNTSNFFRVSFFTEDVFSKIIDAK